MRLRGAKWKPFETSVLSCIMVDKCFGMSGYEEGAATQPGTAATAPVRIPHSAPLPYWTAILTVPTVGSAALLSHKWPVFFFLNSEHFPLTFAHEA